LHHFPPHLKIKEFARLCLIAILALLFPNFIKAWANNAKWWLSYWAIRHRLWISGKGRIIMTPGHSWKLEEWKGTHWDIKRIIRFVFAIEKDSWLHFQLGHKWIGFVGVFITDRIKLRSLGMINLGHYYLKAKF
jgi:hypothetical protein